MRLQAVRDACLKDSSERIDEDIDGVLEFVKDVKCFAKLDPDQVRAIAGRITLEVFAPKQFICQRGDRGDKFYIILTGQVAVHRQAPPAEENNDSQRTMEMPLYLERGNSFGDLALQSDKPRSASVQACEITELLVTTRADYEKYAGAMNRRLTDERVRFLRQCPRIEDALYKGFVTKQDIAAMANCLTEGTLSGNAMVVRQGDEVENMIFVRSGSLAILRLVDVDAVVEAKQRPPASRRQPERPPEGEAEPQIQLTINLAANLAKAMMDLKRTERENKLKAIEKQESEQREKDAEKLAKARGQAKIQNLPSVKAVTMDMAQSGEESRGKQLWKKVQAAFRQAGALKALAQHQPPPEERSRSGSLEANYRDIEQFSSVQAARSRLTRLEAHKLATACRQRVHSRGKANAIAGLDSPPSPASPLPTAAAAPVASPFAEGGGPRRKRLLRIGTIGAYQYFGDQQVSSNECYPVSLISDPVAEIYQMSKHDILRRLPKKLFSALFVDEKQSFPSDAQLLEMRRQTDRWDTFRHSIQEEALNRRMGASSMPRALRDPTSTSRVDVNANLEFLGVKPDGQSPETMRPPRRQGVALLPKDEEYFGQASAGFLRRVHRMKNDPDLQKALAKVGRNSRQKKGKVAEDAQQDPMAFWFDQYWAKLRREDPIGLDLDKFIDDALAKLFKHDGSPSPEADGPGGGQRPPPSMSSGSATARTSNGGLSLPLLTEGDKAGGPGGRRAVAFAE